MKSKSDILPFLSSIQITSLTEEQSTNGEISNTEDKLISTLKNLRKLNHLVTKA